MKMLSGIFVLFWQAMARPPILMAMAATGLLVSAMTRRRVCPTETPSPQSSPEPRSRFDDWGRRSDCYAAEAKSGFLASCRRAEPEDYKRWLAVGQTLRRVISHPDQLPIGYD